MFGGQFLAFYPSQEVLVVFYGYSRFNNYCLGDDQEKIK